MCASTLSPPHPSPRVYIVLSRAQVGAVAALERQEHLRQAVVLRPEVHCPAATRAQCDVHPLLHCTANLQLSVCAWRASRSILFNKHAAHRARGHNAPSVAARLPHEHAMVKVLVSHPAVLGGQSCATQVYTRASSLSPQRTKWDTLKSWTTHGARYYSRVRCSSVYALGAIIGMCTGLGPAPQLPRRTDGPNHTTRGALPTPWPVPPPPPFSDGPSPTCRLATCRFEWGGNGEEEAGPALGGALRLQSALHVPLRPLHPLPAWKYAPPVWCVRVLEVLERANKKHKRILYLL